MIAKEQLYEEYITLGHDRNYIAEKYGMTKSQVAHMLQRNDIIRNKNAKHGLSKHPLNIVWHGMKERCNNPNAENYEWYGGRGITVCEEWSEDFTSFYNWAIENGWQKGYELERIDNSKGYGPDNCTWITHKQQCRNRRSNKAIEIDGESKLMCEWEEELGLKPKALAKMKYRIGEDKMIERVKEMVHESKRHRD